MTREEVFTLVRDHLADELELDADRISEDDALQGGSRGRLARPLHARAGAGGHLRGPDLRRAGREDPHRRPGRRLRLRPRRSILTAALACRAPRRAAAGPRAAGVHARLLDRAARRLLRALGLPRRLRPGAGGDDAPLPAPGGGPLRRGPADEDPRAGGLGPLVRAVAERIGVAERLKAAAPSGVGTPVEALVRTERVLASVVEAIIGACYLECGLRGDLGVRWSRRSRRRSSGAGASRWISSRSCRSGWRATRRSWSTRWSGEEGPPHDRTFEVEATVAGRAVGARQRALEEGRGAGGRGARWRWTILEAE